MRCWRLFPPSCFLRTQTLREPGIVRVYRSVRDVVHMKRANYQSAQHPATVFPYASFAAVLDGTHRWGQIVERACRAVWGQTKREWQLEWSVESAVADEADNASRAVSQSAPDHFQSTAAAGERPTNLELVLIQANWPLIHKIWLGHRSTISADYFLVLAENRERRTHMWAKTLTKSSRANAQNKSRRQR